MADMHLEVHVIPVSDVERSKHFYENLGWRLDDDSTPAAPEPAQGVLTVSDIRAAHDDPPQP